MPRPSPRTAARDQPVIPVPFTIDILPDKFIVSGIVGITVSLGSAILPYRRTAALDPIEVINSG